MIRIWSRIESGWLALGPRHSTDVDGHAWRGEEVSTGGRKTHSAVELHPPELFSRQLQSWDVFSLWISGLWSLEFLLWVYSGLGELAREEDLLCHSRGGFEESQPNFDAKVLTSRPGEGSEHIAGGLCLLGLPKRQARPKRQTRRGL